MSKIKGYIVWLIPKYNNVPERVLRPYKNDISWTKQRAKKEAEFTHKNSKIVRNGNYSMPYNFSELYKYRVISADSARKKGLI